MVGINNKILWTMIFITFIMALYNWYDEGHYVYFATNFLAILGGTLAIIVSAKSSKRQPRLKVLYMIITYVSVIFGLVAYTIYAFNGSTKDLQGAQHMHIIMFPIIHITLTVFALAFIEIIGFILKVFYPNKIHKNTSK